MNERVLSITVSHLCLTRMAEHAEYLGLRDSTRSLETRSDGYKRDESECVFILSLEQTSNQPTNQPTNQKP